MQSLLQRIKFLSPVGDEGTLQALQVKVVVFTVIQQAQQTFTPQDRQERHWPHGSSLVFIKPKALA